MPIVQCPGVFIRYLRLSFNGGTARPYGLRRQDEGRSSLMMTPATISAAPVGVVGRIRKAGDTRPFMTQNRNEAGALPPRVVPGSMRWPPAGRTSLASMMRTG